MEICERKSILIRPPLANLDLIFITIAAAKPMPALDVVDKLSCIAHHNGIDCAIIVTKSELDRENAANIAEIYSKTPYKVFITSAAEDEGIAQLRDYITGEFAEGSPKICAFAGASGVGKSTLLSKIFPDFAPDTGSVSKIGRGRHTTRAVTLYPIPGTDGKSKIADTPGFSLLDFTRFDFFELEELAATFPEFDEHIGKCRYTKCTHLREDGCSIVEAVKQHNISKERHNSYVSLFAELKEKAKHKYD
jgi:ribosome biogenesis GTPase